MNMQTQQRNSSPLSSSDGAFFALDTPMTPDDLTREHAQTHTPLGHEYSSSRHSATGSSTDTHLTTKRLPFWRHAPAFLRLNAVQRILSAAVLVPLVTKFLWSSPAFATATVCAFVTSVCSYEYAWLAHRIHTRILDKVAAFEHEPLTPAPATRASFTTAAADTLPQQHTDANTSNSSDLAPLPHGCFPSEIDHERSPTSSSTSSSVLRCDVPPALHTPDVLNRPLDDPINPSDSSVSLISVDASQCAVSSIAARYFGHNEWLAALVLACLSTTIMSSAFLVFAPWIQELRATELYTLRIFYAVTTDYVASLSALFTPNWRYAFICVVEKMVFTLLTLHSTICPINQFSCGLSMEPAQVFLSGVVIVLLFRLHTRETGSFATASSASLALFLHIVLDLLGYLYIVGSLSVIVAFVDDEQLEAYRRLLIVLLYVVWASDTGAYLTGKLLVCLNYKSYRPLAPHLSANKDYEGTLGAIVFGVVAMHLASDVLDVNGSVLAKMTFTVLAVIAGRIGDLFESLLKRAAGVKDSGRLIPGHGGMLDRIDALMFASLVFARYYAMIVVPNMDATTTATATNGKT